MRSIAERAETLAKQCCTELMNRGIVSIEVCVPTPLSETFAKLLERGALIVPGDLAPPERARQLLIDSELSVQQPAYPKLIKLLSRAITTGYAEAEQVHSELVNDILRHAPELYDCDAAAEAIAVSYVRDLEELRDRICDLLPAAITKELLSK